MKDNRTNMLCIKCNSHIIVYKSKGKYIYECSYCGHQPKDIHSDSIASLIENSKEPMR